MQGTSALIRSYLHLFFYLISAVGGERQLGGCCRVDGGTRRGEKERDGGGEKRFLALRWQTITGLPHKLDCRSLQMYVAINPPGENNGDSFCKWRKT